MHKSEHERLLDEGGLRLAEGVIKYQKLWHKRFDRGFKVLVATHAKLRLDQGWTQRQVANEIGLSVSTISDWMG